jgi:membrane associated rhomboid family serine protease
MPRPTNRLSLLSRLTPVVTWLIGIFIALFLIFSLSGTEAKLFLIRWLALTPDSLLGGEVWKLVTTTFLAGTPITFLLDVVVLWMFVPTLERAWGRKRFLTFFFLTSITGNLVAALFGLWFGPAAIIGMAPFLYAAIAAFGVQWADAPVQFFGVIPMKAKVLAIGVTIIMLIATLLNREWALCLGHTAAIAVAVAYVGEPRLWLLRLRRFWLASQRQKLMKRYTVLPGGRAKSDKKDDKSWLN